MKKKKHAHGSDTGVARTRTAPPTTASDGGAPAPVTATDPDPVETPAKRNWLYAMLIPLFIVVLGGQLYFLVRNVPAQSDAIVPPSSDTDSTSAPHAVARDPGHGPGRFTRTGPAPPPDSAGRGGNAPGAPSAPALAMEMEEFITGLAQLDQSNTPLSASQAQRMCPILEDYVTLQKQQAAAMMAIIGVLTKEQWEVFLQPHPMPPPTPTEGVDIRTVAIDRLMAAYKEKAAANGATPSTDAPPSRLRILDRFMLTSALITLESTPQALSPAQARTALDNLGVLRDAIHTSDSLKEKLANILTPEQKAALGGQPPGPSARLGVTVWLLSQYLKKH